VESVNRRNRKRKILELLEERGTMNINELAEILGVSPITLRKDLKDLEEQHLISKIWGGVTLSTHPISEPPFEDRKVENLEEKRAIARVALTLVKPGDVIGLGGGTTTYEFAKLLGGIPNIQVVTNAINIAHLLIRLGVRIIVPGGFSRDGSYILVDDRIENFFKEIFIDKCFIGVDGIDLEVGFTTLNPNENKLINTMLNSSKMVIVLADHTKIGQRRLIPMAPIEKGNVLITDEKAPKDLLSLLTKKGIKIEIAPLKPQDESYSQSEYKFK